ncbi:MAG: hypothetical protein ACUVSX_11985 [Aggregatilineales bacterium]
MKRLSLAPIAPGAARRYRARSAVRPEPLDRRVFPAAPPAEAARRLIVFFSDSRAQDWPAQAREAA